LEVAVAKGDALRRANENWLKRMISARDTAAKALGDRSSKNFSADDPERLWVRHIEQTIASAEAAIAEIQSAIQLLDRDREDEG
jgi:hypothetical protein